MCTNAFDVVKDGLPYKMASKDFSVQVMALKKRDKGKNKLASGIAKISDSKRTVFTFYL